MRRNESYAPTVGDRMGHRSIADGESRRETAERGYRAMARLVQAEASPVVVVTHGGMLTFLVAAWVGMPLEAASHIAVNSDAGGITHLSEDDRRFNRWIQRLNDTSHLDGLD
jgi:probable phosphoglycerate mutase